MSSESRASQLVGSTPTGAVRRLSLATRRCLQQIINEGVPTAVVVGVSGGPDSLALLVVATDLCRRWNIPVAGVYVDHRIRPESSNEARHVYDVVQSVGAHPAIMDADMEAYREGGPEARARSARRDALVRYATQWARESGTTAATILLGHTMDDQAETVMLRLARGSGAHSLSAMRRRDLMECGGVAITWLRPLLDQRRVDTHQVCRDLKLAWVDDPTNAVDGPWRASDGSALRRAAVRQWALPALERALGVDPIPALARSADMLGEDDAYLSAQAGDLFDACVRESEGARDGRSSEAEGVRGAERGQVDACEQSEDNDSARGKASRGRGRHWIVDCTKLADLAAPIRRRVLHRLLAQVSNSPGSVSSVHVRQLDEMALSGAHGTRIDVPGGHARVERSGPRRSMRRLIVERAE